MRKVLVVKNRSQLDVGRFLAQFRESLGPQAPDFQSDVLDSLAEVPQWFAKHASPSLAFVDWGQESRNAVDPKHLEQALNGMRTLDPHLSLILLTEAMPESQETMHWLDRGATGLLARDFTPGQVTDALAEILGRKLAVERPRHARVPGHHKVILRAASLEQGVVSETLNIGTGGLFARTIPEGAKTGDRVDFELHLTTGIGGNDTQIEVPAAVRRVNEESGVGLPKGQILRGSGFIVWIRRTPAAGLAEGLGLQFDHLDDDARKTLDHFIMAHRVRAFIPLS